jgi:hypothetical protein
LKPSTDFSGDNKTGRPLHHYQTIYQDLDPLDIARRCNLEYSSEQSCFSLRLLGTEYRIPHPVFAMVDSGGNEAGSPYEKILIMHYLCEGKFFPARGKQLSYSEIPWGAVYMPAFEGRCLRRSAFTFGKNIPGFKQMIENSKHLRAEPQSTGDVSYRFEFINGLYLTFILWQGDEEFPPAAQMLFDDNFPFAFTAEDTAVVGEIVIGRLKGLMPK